MLNNACETTLTRQIPFMTPYRAYRRAFISRGEESSSVQKNALLQDKEATRETNNDLLRRGVRICLCRWNDCNDYDSLRGVKQQHTKECMQDTISIICFQYISIEMLF